MSKSVISVDFKEKKITLPSILASSYQKDFFSLSFEKAMEVMKQNNILEELENHLLQILKTGILIGVGQNRKGNT